MKERKELKSSTRLTILPIIGLLMIGWLSFGSLCGDSRHKAAVRLNTALMGHDIDSIFEFVDSREKEALQLDLPKFRKFMDQEFYKEWRFASGEWNSRIQATQIGEAVYIEDLNTATSNNALGLTVVGTEGHYRVPSFIYFALYFTALKRYGVDMSLLKAGGLSRMAPLCHLIESDGKALGEIGIYGTYDPETRGISLLSESRSRWLDEIARWREKHSK